MAVVEIFLSAFLPVLLDKLVSPEVIKFLRREGLHTTIQKWTEKLETIRDVLNDAEEKQITEASINRWLEKLEDLAYDVDDMLDVFATEALSRKQLDLTRSLIPACCSNFSPSAIGFKLRIRSKIEEINGRLEDIHDQKTKLSLERIPRRISARALEKRDSTALVNESYVCGRDGDRDEIIKLLLNDEATNKKYGVISIAGMGGVGKTTLAQLVYNHEKVQQHFHLKAWVCVSDDFNIEKIMKSILRSVSLTTKDLDDLSLSGIQIKLKETLTERKFLVVLDDVWNHKSTDWDVLWIPFGAGAQGSRVIVTTRKREVASQMETDQNHLHYLNQLSKDDCWLVFKQYAFENINIAEHQNLESIGKKIAEKCAGLPLAARTLGGILRSKPEKEEWDKILDSEIWDLRESESNILPALRLSYHHLPPHLKRCFAYCSIFPKDHEFSEKEIVLLWMAEGFLQQQRETLQQQREKQMEDLGHEYFGDLLSMSFFQQSTSKTWLFVMHDLINDLAQWVAGEKCFMLEDNLEGKKHREISRRARHLSYVSDEYDGIKKFKAFEEVKCIRTFLTLNTRIFGGNYLTNHVPFVLLPKLRCLRVLSLAGYRIVELPNSIGDLKHLRFLDLSHNTSIRRLPESISTLYNLQTLILSYCFELEKLPEKLSNIFNLRHLDISDSGDLLKEMPVGMDKLTSLQTLSKFVVGEGSGCRIRELGKLVHLRGTLRISGLQNVTHAFDASEARLIHKHSLNDLELHWSDEFDGSRRNESDAEKVVDMLQPHKNLEHLSIWGKLPDHLPSLETLYILHCEQLVVSILRLPKLHKLAIRGCQEVVLPRGTDGLSSLKSMELSSITKPLTHLTATEVVNLEIEGCNEVTSLWGKEVGFLQNLTSLKELTIRNCPRLVSLVGEEVEEEEQQGLPSTSLESLTLRYCENLEQLRGLHSLTSLREITIQNCPRLESFAETVLPSTLRELRIHECSALKSLRFQKMRQCTESASSVEQQQQQLGVPSKLESLRLFYCTNLEELQVLPSIRRLSIHACHALKSLQLVMMHCSNNAYLLEELDIERCGSLTSLPSSRGELPATLKRLSVKYCPKLESVVERLHGNASLETIDIWGCESLKSLPEGLYNLTSLRHLNINFCDKLSALPDRMHDLNSLQQLSISYCAGIVSFPEEGFPTNLTILKIGNLEISKPLFDWGLHRLTSLQELEIYDTCPDLVSFPEKEKEKRIILPTSLTKLSIGEFPNLEYLSFHTLQSLTSLSISGCPKLKSFPKEGLSLSSLEYLEINDCPKLKSFPKEGLPLSLLQLHIEDCPLLKRQCEKDKGRDWPKIAHIPCVEIDGWFIYESPEIAE